MLVRIWISSKQSKDSFNSKVEEHCDPCYFIVIAAAAITAAVNFKITTDPVLLNLLPAGCRFPARLMETTVLGGTHAKGCRWNNAVSAGISGTAHTVGSWIEVGHDRRLSGSVYSRRVSFTEVIYTPSRNSSWAKYRVRAHRALVMKDDRLYRPFIILLSLSLSFPLFLSKVEGETLRLSLSLSLVE